MYCETCESCKTTGHEYLVDGKCLTCAEKYIETLENKNRALSDRLPSYIDTKEPIVPGMFVYFWDTSKVSADWVVRYVFNDSMNIKKGETIRYLHKSKAFSTAAAAGSPFYRNREAVRRDL